MLRGEKINGKVVDKLPCTMCDSSDALRVYEKVHPSTGKVFYDATCFSCNGFERHPPGYKSAEGNATQRKGGLETMQSPYTSHTTTLSASDIKEQLEEFNTYPFRAIKERGITQETCEKYNVRVSLSPNDGATIVTHMYPGYRKNKVVRYKERVVENKNFFIRGDTRAKVELFGSQAFPQGGKTLYITEGELDAMSLYQVLRTLSSLENYHPAVVSLNNGAAAAVKDVLGSIDYVSSFEKIVLVLDQDEAGEAATEDLCKLLAGKVYVAKLSEKDANAMLLAGKGEEMKWEVLKHAKLYMPDNIVNYSDCWDRYKNSRNQISYPFPKSWSKLNDMTYGCRDGELIMVTSGSGMGKTQLLRELKYHYFETTDFKIADIALEEDVGDSIAGLLSLRLNKRILLPDVEVTEEEERSAFNYFFESGRWTGYDYFGGMDNDNLFTTIRVLAAQGHKMIFLDHLSIIVSEYAADGGERERIDTIMTKLAKMVKELGIVIFLVVHLKKTSTGTSFEEGATPSLDDLRGSGTLKQLSMTVLTISRNQQHEDPFCANTSKVTVLKCRFTGRTGTADYLHFNDKTGRMNIVPCPADYERKSGNSSGFKMSENSNYTQRF